MNVTVSLATVARMDAYSRVRSETARLCLPLETEDYGLQGMPDVSPAKWHLAHTTWFFEHFLLEPFAAGYRAYHPQFNRLFNSYYVSAGERHPRAERGLLSRPTVREIYDYRRAVDEAVTAYLDQKEELLPAAAARVFETGLHHEQQHQELILTDIKYNFFLNPLRPAYRLNGRPSPAVSSAQMLWMDDEGGTHQVGHDGAGFSFDNERPAHPAALPPFSLASRLVTNGEYLEFMADGGYSRPGLWLADGWETASREKWQAPLYWEKSGSGWTVFTLSGTRAMDPAEPVCHVSFYEADAYARWAKARLPREEEWETAAKRVEPAGNFRESAHLQPRPAEEKALTAPAQLYGDVWEWTGSAYLPYPGFRADADGLSEYNGKFMINQMVLRGGSCVTPASHIRATYRNYFYPHQRWQFTGLRLARDWEPGPTYAGVR